MAGSRNGRTRVSRSRISRPLTNANAPPLFACNSSSDERNEPGTTTLPGVIAVSRMVPSTSSSSAIDDSSSGPGNSPSSDDGRVTTFVCIAHPENVDVTSKQHRDSTGREVLRRRTRRRNLQRRHDQQGILCGDFVEATFIERSLRNFPGSQKGTSIQPARREKVPSFVGGQRRVARKNLVALSSRAFAHAVGPRGRTAWAKAPNGHCLIHAVPRAFAHPTSWHTQTVKFNSIADDRQPSAYATVESSAISARRELSLVCCTTIGTSASNTDA